VSPPADREEGSRALGLALVTTAFLLMALLIFLPAVLAILRTLQVEDAGGVARWSLANYAAFFADPVSRADLLFTLWVTLASIGLLFLTGGPIALFLRFLPGPLGAWVQTLALFPLFVPGIIIAYALIRFLGPNGLLATLLRLVGIVGYATPYLHAWGVIIGLVWEGLPLTVLVLTAGLAQVPDPALEAARDVGAGPLRVLTAIVLPQVGRSLVISFALGFLNIFSSFTVPYLLGPAAPQMMSVFMQRTFTEARAPERADTQAVVTFAVCVLVGLLYSRSVARERRAA